MGAPDIEDNRAGTGIYFRARALNYGLELGSGTTFCDTSPSGLAKGSSEPVGLL